MSEESRVPANVARYQRGAAAEIGCTIDDFRSNRLTVVERPADCLEPFLLKAVTFGTGTVISVEPSYVEFVRDIAIEPHYRALYAQVWFQPLVDEGKRRGDDIAWRGPGLGFVPGRSIEALPIPQGLELVRVEAAWREEHLPSREFSNALGDPDDTIAAELWQFALLLVDAAAAPAAIAGAYILNRDDPTRDGYDHLEIGVDVARAHRGEGLAPVVVTAMAAEAERMGLLATYYCAPSNIRSQRTAWSCGFVPALSHAVARIRTGG
jgi:hypothetical protein